MPDDVRWLKSTVNDLNNLLQEISGYVHLARESSTVSSEAFSYLKSCMSSIQRASTTVQSVLSHLDDGVIPTGAMPASENQTQAPASMSLPAAPAADTLGFKGLKSQSTGEINGVPVTNPVGQKELVMVVDDEVHVMLLAKMMLAENGYRVVTAKDGFEALENYRKIGSQIDLVILDFTMPGMHGDQVFEELRKINPNVAVVLSSGFADQTKLNRMFAQGLKEFIAKPYTQQRLLAEIRSVLDAKP